MILTVHYATDFSAFLIYQVLNSPMLAAGKKDESINKWITVFQDCDTVGSDSLGTAVFPVPRDSSSC